MANVVLRAGKYEAAFRPDVAMLGTSFRHGDEEYVAWPRNLAEFRAGHMTALPLVHPWANRLASRTYKAAGKRVDLTGLDLPTDPRGLLMHGDLRGAAFDVVRADDTRVVARFDWSAHPDKMRSFPFAHTLTVDARLDASDGLSVTTEVRATGDRAVPISFGWHPFLKLPYAPRSEWTLQWPRCERVEVDERVLPTGTRTPLARSDFSLAARTFDDHFALGADRTFGLAARGRALVLRFGRAYSFAQLYVPARRPLCAIEPMTATIDALGRGTTPMCAPGETFRATFRMAVT